MKIYKSIYENNNLLYEMSFIRGAEMFIGRVNNFDENGISSLDKKNKDIFLRFCKSIKLTYKNLTWQQILDLEREVKKSDWDELSPEDKAKVEKLVVMMDSHKDYK